MPLLADKSHCCGCGACASTCNKHAISMQANDEGFLHPVVDLSECIDCRKCEKACPAISLKKHDSAYQPRAYIVQHKDEMIRHESTSGGAFTAIAEEIINRGGVVFGAVLCDDFVVRHQSVETLSGLERFRNSKYVQSDLGGAYIEGEKILKSGRWVCFSGTPCQISGFKSYLNCDYENLILVDVVCHAVPSPLIWALYIKYQKGKYPTFNKAVFRDKSRGYSYSTMALYDVNNSSKVNCCLYRKGAETDEWFRLFLGDRYNRLSCYSCLYQNGHRESDFTLWDRWDIAGVRKDWNDNKGTTNLLVWSRKGEEVLRAIQERLRCQEYPVQPALNNANRSNSVKPASNRDEFYADAHQLTAPDFFEKYVPLSLKVRLKDIGRYLIWKLKLHNQVRYIVRAMRK